MGPKREPAAPTVPNLPRLRALALWAAPSCQWRSGNLLRGSICRIRRWKRLDEQGHAPFAWSVLGAAAQATPAHSESEIINLVAELIAKSLVAGLLRLLVYGAITSPVPG